MTLSVLFAQSPGGVHQDLVVWLKADAGTNTTSPGTPLATWNDQTGSGLNATQTNAANRPSYQSSLNFNPFLAFSNAAESKLGIVDSPLLNTATSKTEESIVISFQTSVNISSRQILYEQGGSTRGLSIILENSQVYVGGWNFASDGAGAPWGYLGVSGVIEENTSYVVTLIYNGDDALTGSISGFLNGNALGSVSGVGRLYTHNDDVAIGGLRGSSAYPPGSNGGGTNSFEGKVSEVIVYNQALSSANRHSIETYLSIKWGTTLAVGSHDHFSLTGYDQNMAGIGRSDAQGLNQMQSKNPSGGIVTFGDAASLDDEDYYVWGHDGGPLALTNLGVPVGVINRLERVWQLEETGELGAMDLSFDLRAFNYSGKLVTDFVLLVDPSDSDFSDVIPVQASSFDGTTVSFTGINLSTLNFFSLGVPEPDPIAGPGGVGENLEVWLEADNGTNTSVVGNGITSWLDQSGNGRSAFQTSGASRPLYQEFWNFNPYVDFTSTSNLSFTLNNNVALNLDPLKSEYAIVMTFKTGEDIATRQVLYEQGGSSRGVNMYVEAGKIHFGAWNVVNDGVGSSWGLSNSSSNIEAEKAYVVSFIYQGTSSNTGTVSCYLNGSLVTTLTNIGFLYPHSGAIGIGGMNGGSLFPDGSGGSNGYYFQGGMSEFLIYSRTLNQSDRLGIENYLAIKWGISLSSTVNAFYNVTGHNTNTFGIGQDQGLQLFSQPSAQSCDPTDILTLSSPSSLDDGDYLVVGNDGAAPDLTTLTGAHPSFGERLTRTWSANKTNDPGTVTVSFDLSQWNYGANSASDFGLLIDPTDINFGDATVIPATSFDGSTVEFTGVDLQSGDYFTLGMPSEPPVRAPGGVFDSLGVWLRADEGTSSMVNGSGVATWLDQSGKGLHATCPTTTNYPLYRSNAVNGNAALAFESTDQRFFTIASNTLINLAPSRTEESVVMALRTSNDVTSRQVLFEQGGSARGLNMYVYNGSVYFGGWNLSASDGAGAPWGFSYVSSPVDTSNTYVISMIYEGNDAITGSISCYVNGQLVGTIANVGRLYQHSGSIGLGATVNDTYFEAGARNGNGNYFDGEIAEFILHGYAISESERRGIETYLSVKYGVGLPATSHNFFNDTYTDYDHQVAGIGKAVLAEGLFQTASKNQGDSVRVAISNPSQMSEGEYLVWGDNNAEFCNTNNVPPGLRYRFERVWRVTETGEVGTVTVTGLLKDFTGGDPLGIRLLINNNTDFSNATAIVPSAINGETLQFQNVNFNDGDFFTFGNSNLFSVLAPPDTTQWSGTANSSWGDPDNWNFCGVPEDGAHIRIFPGGNAPQLDRDVVFGDFKLDPGAQFDLNGYTLRVQGDFINEGDIAPNGGHIIFEGSGAQVIRTESATLYEDVTIENAAGVTLGDGDFRVHGTLEVNNGSLTTNGRLVLTSDATGTGRIGEVAAGDIEGKVTMERYIDNSQKQWRYLATPFVDTKVDDWQKDFAITGPFDGASTGSGLGELPSLYWYDETVDGTEILEDYVGFPTTDSSEVLTNGRGYATYIRDKGGLTFSTTGTPQVGTVNFPLTYTSGQMSEAMGWNLLGNPYPSQIDWNASSGWTKTGVNDAIYFTDNESGLNVSFVNGFSVPSGQADGIISSGQAFWVRATSSSAALTATEQVKTGNTQRFYKDAEVPTQLELFLLNIGTGAEDECLIYFDHEASRHFEPTFDAEKFHSVQGMEFGTRSSDGTLLVINGWKSPNDFQERIPLSMSVPGQDAYRLTFDLEALEGEWDVMLVNEKEGIYIDLRTVDEVELKLAKGANEGYEIRLGNLGVVLESSFAEHVASQVHPNPVTAAQFNFYAANEGTFDVFDSRGMLQFTQSLSLGDNVLQLPGEIQNGVYTYRFLTEDQVVSGQFSVQHP